MRGFRVSFTGATGALVMMPEEHGRGVLGFMKIDVVASEVVHRVRSVSAQTVAKVLPLRTLWLSILDSPRPGHLHLHPRECASVMTDLTSVSLPQFTGILVEGVRERPLLSWAFFDEWSRLRLHDEACNCGKG